MPSPSRSPADTPNMAFRSPHRAYGRGSYLYLPRRDSPVSASHSHRADRNAPVSDRTSHPELAPVNHTGDSSITHYEYNVKTYNVGGPAPATSYPAGVGWTATPPERSQHSRTYAYAHTRTYGQPTPVPRTTCGRSTPTAPAWARPTRSPWFAKAIPAGPPDAPTGLTAAAGNRSVTLNWNNPGDSSIIRYEYNVNHNDTGTGNLSGWSPWTAIPQSDSNTTQHTFTNLTNGREYRYHLRAVNNIGPSVGAPRRATLVRPRKSRRFAPRATRQSESGASSMRPVLHESALASRDRKRRPASGPGQSAATPPGHRTNQRKDC